MTTLSLFAQACFADDVQADYRFGPGDLVRIQVYGESDLTMDVRLSESGTISYPFLGEIKLLGMTVGQLQKLIGDGLKQGYLVNPRVSVSVLEYRKFFVNGEVKNPGGYAYQPGLNVRKAVSLAGGFTSRASKDKIYIISEHDPQQTKRTVDQNARVQPGDIVIVDESFF